MVSVVIYGVYVWRQSDHSETSTMTERVNIALFWLHVQDVLKTSASASAVSASQSSSSSSSLPTFGSTPLEDLINFRPFAFSCLFDGYSKVTEFWIVMGFLTGILALFGMAHCIRVKSMERIRHALFICIAVIYFPSLVAMLRVFNCTSLPPLAEDNLVQYVDDRPFMTWNPSVRCGSAPHFAMLVASSIVCSLFGLGWLFLMWLKTRANPQ